MIHGRYMHRGSLVNLVESVMSQYTAPSLHHPIHSKTEFLWRSWALTAGHTSSDKICQINQGIRHRIQSNFVMVLWDSLVC